VESISVEFRFDDQFREICQQIYSENRDVDEWSELESDDMFQQGVYVGGFDADEREFCFSVYLESGEFWFQVSLDQIGQIVARNLLVVDIRPCE
jgi:hypothetical protein